MGTDPLGFGDIIALLPDGDVLVDRVIRCEPGMMIETWKAVSGAEPCYRGRPAALDYPADLLLASFAQSAGLLWARTGGPGAPALAGTRGVTFHRGVRPGALLRTVVKLVPGTSTTMFFAGRMSLVDGPSVMTVDNLVLTVRRPDAVLRSAAVAG